MRFCFDSIVNVIVTRFWDPFADPDQLHLKTEHDYDDAALGELRTSEFRSNFSVLSQTVV